MLQFFDKVRWWSFLIMGILVCLAWYAGCLDESDTITRTPATMTPVIQAKFVKGDIIAMTASSADSYFIILNYDSMTGRYERAFVYQKTDGSWYRYNNKSEFSDRDLIEKIYTVKVGYVPVSLIPVKTPVPVLVTPNVVPVPSKTGAPPSQSLGGMAPAARFTASPVQGQSPLTVQFTDTSVSAGSTSYQWDLNNDGIVDSSAKNPVYTYQKTGNYTVKLTVTNTSGSDSEVKTNYIRVSSSVTQTPIPT
ncbi:MAG: PKD domain-containing protein, partial [Methanoregula sp.]|nr:PKD domain-containing protein [Methanoregula sp.]